MASQQLRKKIQVELGRTMNRVSFSRFHVLLSVFVVGIILCAGMWAQSADSRPTASGDASRNKAKRVWTEDDLQQLSGAVNVVGQDSGSRKAEQQRNEAAPVPVTAPVPRYKLEFTAKTIDGQVYTEEATKGKVLLLQFWATWCPHCMADQAPLNRIYSDFAGRGLVVLAVDVGEPENVVQKFLERNPRSCPIVMQKDTDLGSLRTSKGVPNYVLVDRGGNVVGSRSGELGDAGLRSFVRKAGL